MVEGGQMQDRLLAAAVRLSDADLLRRVVVLAGREREATVELVAHLAELDARRLYRGEGFGSLFSYCTGALRLAEHAAYNRIEAARASRRVPAILDLLADGSLNLSTVRLLAPHMRPDNFEALVSMAKGKSKREVEALVARLAPRPDMAASVRRLPAPAQSAAVPPPAQPEAAQPAVPTAGAASATREAFTDEPATAPAASLARRAVVTPLAPERYRVQFTVGEATHEKLRRVQDLLRREISDGDLGAIFDRALTLLLEDVARKKVALTSQPRNGRAAATRSRHIPARVRRAVWLRDGGRCAFVTSAGRRCHERAFLEFHHREPYAIGGETTVANISLRCRQHNVYEGELAFGTSTRGIGGEPAGRRGHGGRAPAEVRAEAIRSNSPRGELDTSCRQANRPARQAASQGVRLESGSNRETGRWPCRRAPGAGTSVSRYVVPTGS
jgi:hypothetical protein